MADDAFVTQTIAEVTKQAVSNVRTTQVVVELVVINRPPTSVLITQTLVEYSSKATTNDARVSHTIVEVVRQVLAGGGIYFINRG
jgi:hypothetical protein